MEWLFNLAWFEIYFTKPLNCHYLAKHQKYLRQAGTSTANLQWTILAIPEIPNASGCSRANTALFSMAFCACPCPGSQWAWIPSSASLTNSSQVLMSPQRRAWLACAGPVLGLSALCSSWHRQAVQLSLWQQGQANGFGDCAQPLCRNLAVPMCQLVCGHQTPNLQVKLKKDGLAWLLITEAW